MGGGSVSISSLIGAGSSTILVPFCSHAAKFSDTDLEPSQSLLLWVDPIYTEGSSVSV